MNDRLLDIVVLEEFAAKGLSTKLAQFLDLQKPPLAPQPNGEEPSNNHNPVDLSRIPGHHLQVQGITIRTGANPQDVTLDGEVRGQTPIHIRLANERLRVIAPQ